MDKGTSVDLISRVGSLRPCRNCHGLRWLHASCSPYMRAFMACVERRFVEWHWRIALVKALRWRLRAPAQLPCGEQSAQYHHQMELLFVRDSWSLRIGAYQLHIVPCISFAALPHGISLLLFLFKLQVSSNDGLSAEDSHAHDFIIHSLGSHSSRLFV